MRIVHETVNRLTNVEAFAKRTHDLEQLTSSMDDRGVRVVATHRRCHLHPVNPKLPRKIVPDDGVFVADDRVTTIVSREKVRQDVDPYACVVSMSLVMGNAASSVNCLP